MSAAAVPVAAIRIRAALGDGTDAEIAVSGLDELERVIGRMAAACARDGCPLPPIAISGPGLGAGDRPDGEPDPHPPAGER